MTRGLFPAVSDLARELRYRCFDQPLFERARKQVYARSRRSPRLSGRQSRVLLTGMERLRALVECPQPLVGLFAGRFATAAPHCAS